MTGRRHMIHDTWRVTGRRQSLTAQPHCLPHNVSFSCPPLQWGQWQPNISFTELLSVTKETTCESEWKIAQLCRWWSWGVCWKACLFILSRTTNQSALFTLPHHKKKTKQKKLCQLDWLFLMINVVLTIKALLQIWKLKSCKLLMILFV